MDGRKPSANPVVRAIWLVTGLLLTALGLIGAVLPLLPTVPFLILAAGAFARSSPRLEAWMLNHPVFGPPLRDWRARGAIPLYGKLFGVGGMAGGYTVFLVAARPELWLAIAIAVPLALIAAWILTRPS